MEFLGLRRRLSRWLTHSLMKDVGPAAHGTHLFDFERLCYELRPGDVLLMEGRSHVSEVIKITTQSPWTHSMLYIGRLYDIDNPVIRAKVQANYQGNPDEQLVIEAQLGEGTIISPVRKYCDDHLRICRPKSLSPQDSQQVIAYAVHQVGMEYDVRQIIDLLRFMFPYSFLPRRWRSSLFSAHPGKPTRTVCSTMIAEAFHAVKFPILPFAEKTEDGKIRLFQRNPRLYTPKDFDYSPYFDIIKYPFFGLNDITIYKRLPWENEEIFCNSLNDCYIKSTHEPVDLSGSGRPPATTPVKLDKGVKDDKPDNKAKLTTLSPKSKRQSN